MNRIKLFLASAGLLLSIIGILGAALVIPYFDNQIKNFDSKINNLNINIQQASFTKINADSHLSTYKILKSLNVSSDVYLSEWDSSLDNMRLCIRIQDQKYDEEPFRTELRNIKDANELNRLYNETGYNFTLKYNGIKQARDDSNGLRDGLFILFSSFNIMGFFLWNYVILSSYYLIWKGNEMQNEEPKKKKNPKRLRIEYDFFKSWMFSTLAAILALLIGYIATKDQQLLWMAFCIFIAYFIFLVYTFYIYTQLLKAYK